MLEQWSTAVTTQGVQIALLNQGSGSPWAAIKCVLFVNPVQPTPISKLSDFTLATFDGYTVATPGSPGTPYIGADSFVHVTWPSVQFTMNGTTTPNVVNGWGIVNTAQTVWVGGNLLPGPITMAAVGDGIIIVPDIVNGQ